MTRCCNGKINLIRRAVCTLLATLCALHGGNSQSTDQDADTAPAEPRTDADGAIHVPAFALPLSSYLSPEMRAAWKEAHEVYLPELAKADRACPPFAKADAATMPAIRKCLADAFYKTSFYKGLRKQYDVVMTPQEIGGVYTEVFTPRAGIASKNEERVLINLHGSGFQCCARTLSHTESMPIASVGQIKVISIDYRMAPEHTFPAASEDVAAVYRKLLKTYKPANIGIYGCSAGGVLTAQSMAWFQKHGLPLPGAIGMFSAAAAKTSEQGDPKNSWTRNDLAAIGGAILGVNFEEKGLSDALPFDYFGGIDRRSPLATPGNDDAVVARFPPSLLVTGTRDFSGSSVLVMHAQLVRLGVEADLHVWEGMPHCFQNMGFAPEGAHEVVVKFFDKHLGTN